MALRDDFNASVNRYALTLSPQVWKGNNDALVALRRQVEDWLKSVNAYRGYVQTAPEQRAGEAPCVIVDCTAQAHGELLTAFNGYFSASNPVNTAPRSAAKPDGRMCWKPRQ